MYTFVSGLETLYVAGCVILLHSHLLPQRLGSHSVDNAIANLQRPIHAVREKWDYHWECMCVHVIFSSLPGCTCFACCLRLSFTDSGSTLFHSAAMQRNTSAPPFNTWRHAQFHNSFTFLNWYLQYDVSLLFTVRLSCWPAEDVDPWRGEPTLSTPAENNQQPISSHLQYSAERHS